MNFAQVKKWIIPEGECTIVYDSNGIIWKRANDPSWNLENTYNISAEKDLQINITDTDYVGWEITSDTSWIVLYNNNNIYGTSNITGEGDYLYTDSGTYASIAKNTSTSSRTGYIYLKRDNNIISTCTIVQSGAISAITWDAKDQTIRSLGYGSLDLFDITITNPELEEWKLESSESWLGFYSGSEIESTYENDQDEDTILLNIEQNHSSQRTCEINLKVKINGVYKTLYTCTITQNAGKADPEWDLPTSLTYNSASNSTLTINITDSEYQGWKIESDDPNYVYLSASSLSGTGNKTVTATIYPNTASINKNVALHLRTTVDSVTYSCSICNITIQPGSNINVDDTLYLRPDENSGNFTIDTALNLTSAQKSSSSDQFTCSVSGKTLSITSLKTGNNTSVSDWNLGSVIISDGVTSKTVKIVKQALDYTIDCTNQKTGLTYTMSRNGSKSQTIEADPATDILVAYTGNATANISFNLKNGVDSLSGETDLTTEQTTTFITTSDVTQYIDTSVENRTSIIDISVLGITNQLVVVLNTNS